jgi:hypothetical protein
MWKKIKSLFRGKRAQRIDKIEKLLRERTQYFRQQQWSLKKWTPSPTLRRQDGYENKYYGQEFDSSQFELIENGWDHDHCEFCSVKIDAHPREGVETEGYTDGIYWICSECYRKYIVEGKEQKSIFIPAKSSSFRTPSRKNIPAKSIPFPGSKDKPLK